MKILILAPETSRYQSLKRMFEQHGANVDLAHTAERCLYLSMTDTYSAVMAVHIADPEELLDFYKKWKAEGCASLFLVLTSRQSGVERAQALEVGIDNYYIEPYSYAKILVEITMHDYRLGMKERTSLKTKYLEIDLLARTVRFCDKHLHLTRTEFDLLALLLKKRGSVIARVQIWEEVWGNREYPLVNTIDVHINRLRRKLKREGVSCITTIHGVGYRISDDI